MTTSNTLKCFSDFENIDLSKNSTKTLALLEISRNIDAKCTRLTAEPNTGFPVESETIPENETDLHKWFSNVIYYGMTDVHVEFVSEDMFNPAIVYFNSDGFVTVEADEQDIMVANKLVMNTLGSVYFYLNSAKS